MEFDGERRDALTRKQIGRALQRLHFRSFDVEFPKIHAINPALGKDIVKANYCDGFPGRLRDLVPTTMPVRFADFP
ncbi:MAG: hypothetical protein QOH88_3595 [Verrucomicrobiota bacterium]